PPPPPPAQTPPPAPKQEPEPEPEIETEPIREYPVGRFGPDELRREYISGEMTLRVPRMDYDGPVFSSEQDITQGTPTYQGVSDNVLDRGPGLFGAAQLPGLGNANVSIAAHRDIVGREFWDIDKMQEGDYIYLTFRGREYVYLFEDSFVTHDKDWDPVRVKEYGVVTLQSCHPIFIASHRMFVVGRLVAVIDDEDSIIFGEYDEYEMDAAA
ncbi:MAG: class E sortase, partial [Oscillospiraceae bacterium]|nr:class E sortase [Oscillospiraceae bacterium]